MLKSILIVEDSPSMQLLLKTQVQSLGVHSIACASNGLEALNRIKDENHDFQGIITDLHMPHMDGMEFLNHLADARFRGGVIVASSLGDRVIESAVNLAREKFVRLVGFLNKPIGIDQLSLMIQRIHHINNDDEVSNALKPRQIVKAIDQSRVIPYYQPKLDCTQNTLKGFELLCRIQMPGETQMVSPNRFIPMAEQSGLIDDLTFNLFGTALQEFTDILKVADDDTLKLSLNLSPNQLFNAKLPKILSTICQQHGIPHSNIILEVTERQILNSDTQISTMDRLRIHGFGVSLDDFGTGFTNIGQLRYQPFTEVKLDQCMVSNIRQDRLAQVILKSMSNITRTLGIDLVAEGVDNIEDYEYISRFEHVQIQGYLLSRPKPKEELIRWIRAWQVQQKNAKLDLS
ncbi:MAG: hypothetical protein COA42_02690 [Alteromonadaceae bacterium]|nr:MAG: hypothetical protein COA42_02690 [Alteromonadaceae bacterium]